MIPEWILVGGVTSPQDARAVEATGAEAVAISLVEGDPRRVRLDEAAEIAAAVTVEVVLELKDPDPELMRSAVLMVQPSRLLIHGAPPAEEPPPLPWFRAFPGRGRQVLTDLKDHPGDRFLLQLDPSLLPGGSAWQRDRGLLREVGRVGAMVLGGIPDLAQLTALIEQAQPWGVRLRACVEREPGWLDHEALDRAMTALRGRRR